MTRHIPNVFPSSMLTGVAAIDDEHRALFARIRAEATGPNQADPATRILLLKSLVAAFAEHFAHEEQLMADTKFIHAAGHAKVHARLLERLRQMPDATEGDRGTAPPGLFDALDALFRDTLLGDAEFANWLEFMRLGRAPQAG
jgi:hemerythrin-like metal-binding protein